MSHAPLKPTDPAIKAYHDALNTFAAHHADHEGATETAFDLHPEGVGALSPGHRPG